MANEKTLATVAGRAITETDVNAFIAELGPQGKKYQSEQGKAVILEELINRALFLCEAQRNLFEAEPAFKEQLRSVKEKLLTSYAIDKTLASVTVTDDEAKKYFGEHPEDFQGQEAVNASHILVDSEEKAKEIKAEIESGVISFEDAAKKYSSCPSSAQGGNLGDFGKGQMVPEFDAAVFAMNEGEMSEPVKTQFGYHLIKLNSKKTAEAVSFGDVRSELREKLLADKQMKTYQSKINQLKIIYPVDKF